MKSTVMRKYFCESEIVQLDLTQEQASTEN